MDIMKMVGAIAAITALIFAIACVAVFSMTGLVYDTGVGTGGQPENIDGIEWVLYFGEIDTGASEGETAPNGGENGQLPDGEKYWVLMDVQLDYQYLYISNNSYFDWQNVTVMLNGKYFAFKDVVPKGANSIPWSEFISDSWGLYDSYLEAADTLVIYIGDIYVDGQHFSGDDYNMEFAYTTGGTASSGSARVIAPKN